MLGFARDKKNNVQKATISIQTLSTIDRIKEDFNMTSNRNRQKSLVAMDQDSWITLKNENER